MNTIIIVPHSKAKFIKFSFSTRSLILACCLMLAASVLSVIAIGYTGSAVSRRAQVVQLDEENKQLAATNQKLEQTIVEVQTRLDEFEERTARLALAAGMDSEYSGTGGLGVGTSRLGSGGTYDRLREAPEGLSLQGNMINQALNGLEDMLLDRSKVLSSTPTIAPVRGIFTDGFGRRKDPFTGHTAFHRGLDISARRGTAVVSPADGIVVFAGRNGGLGKVVRISHGFGYTTVYGHLNKILVSSGEEVHRNQQIALLGSTGRSTGPHLHYEVHQDGRAVDPLYYILDIY